METKIVTLNVNGRVVEVLCRPLMTLQEVIREQLHFTSPKSGCEQGGCGACVVLVDGEPFPSCLTLVDNVENRKILTLEGLGNPQSLHEIQDAFHKEFAYQCGYCTSGMIMVATALLLRNPNPTHEEIIESLSGNSCRCTGYEPIVRAIQRAAKQMRVKETVV